MVNCRNLRIPGITSDGGYAEAMVCPADALAAIPDDLAAAEAAPLVCASITTFNGLRHSGALLGDLVPVLGIGRLGHLGIQFAAKMGFRAVAIARRAGSASRCASSWCLDAGKAGAEIDPETPRMPEAGPASESGWQRRARGRSVCLTGAPAPAWSISGGGRCR